MKIIHDEPDFVSLAAAAYAAQVTTATILRWVIPHGITIACSRVSREVMYDVREVMLAERAERQAARRHAYERLARCLTNEVA